MTVSQCVCVGARESASSLMKRVLPFNFFGAVARVRMCDTCAFRVAMEQPHVCPVFIPEIGRFGPKLVPYVTGNLGAIQRGFDKMSLFEMSGTGMNAMHIVCFLGHHHVVEWLMHAAMMRTPNEQSDMSLRTDNQGRTPMHIACMQGHSDIVRTLLRLRPTLAYGKDDVGGNRAMHYACQYGRANCVAEIMSFFQHVESSEEDPKSFGDILSENIQRYTPLGVACAYGHADCVATILRYVPDAWFTPGNAMLSWAHGARFVPVLEALSERWEPDDACMRDTLLTACKYGILPTIEYILSRPGRADGVVTPEHWRAVCEHGHASCLARLFEASASRPEADEIRSLLELALSNDHAECAEFLRSK